MVKPLSAQLADLSVRAKNAEDAVAAAQKEAHDKVVARTEQAHAAATAAIDKVNRDIKSAGNDVTSHWNALKTKVSADMDAWNAKIAQLKHDRGVKHAENHAERLEWEASFAVDYAVAAIEEAKSAVLDAMVGRMEAGEAKRS
jgi:DNA repair exonuclease SbcCD ATPase subunit